MRTISIVNYLGKDIEVDLQSYIQRWGNTLDIDDIKNLCFSAEADKAIYGELSEIAERLDEIKSELLVKSFNKIYKEQN
jgi:hypothetical protein